MKLPAKNKIQFCDCEFYSIGGILNEHNLGIPAAVCRLFSESVCRTSRTRFSFDILLMDGINIVGLCNFVLII